MFHAFYGDVDIVCGGKYLLHAVYGIAGVTHYDLYDQKLNIVTVFDDVYVKEDGTVFGKPKGKESVILYGKDGSVVAENFYEKVFDIDTYGAAIAVEDKVRFVDENGMRLATVDGYRQSYALEYAEYNSKEKRYFVVFRDTAIHTNVVTITFWFDPKIIVAGRK